MEENTGHKAKDNKAIEARAYAYHLMGLNAPEIGKLLNVSPRTVQRYIKRERVNNPLPKKTKLQAAELYRQGYSYRQIAGIIGRGRTTVYNYLKELQQVSKQ
ncbi:helix-turn-helix domain-containing protein [Chitinophaga sp. HK235]|uniref:helix-turn-helix transcriptional regulator n=1 Tax=Chitinophaga sp. HK235 TaxID=2952571 RepID=UPI001BAC6EDF|nr:helix-turn-helix domain-containing protein [Chitinophaga sp. HK235]